jgi:hypothetical protein
VIPEHQWRENLALVAAWLAEFGGQAIAEPAHIEWESPSTFKTTADADATATPADAEAPDAATRDEPPAPTIAAESGALDNPQPQHS